MGGRLREVRLYKDEAIFRVEILPENACERIRGCDWPITTTMMLFGPCPTTTDLHPKKNLISQLLEPN